MTNIIPYVLNNLPNFGVEQNNVLLMLVSPPVTSADGFTQGALVKMLKKITPLTSTYEKETVIRCIEKIAFFGETPVIFIVNQGEDFAFEVDLEAGKTFEGYGLRAYNAEDGAPLGPAVEGTDADKQDVPVNNLSLPNHHVYRCHVVLEAGAPSSVLLTEAFLIVEDTIDYGDIVVEGPPIVEIPPVLEA